MTRHKLSFFFDYGGDCLWGNDGAVRYSTLPISDDIKIELDAMNSEFSTSLDWADPLSPSPWTEEHKADFIARANAAYEKLKNELGEEYEVTNEVSQ